MQNANEADFSAIDACYSESPSPRSGLWLDAPDAWTQLRDRARNDVLLQRVGQELIEFGFTVVPGVQDSATIDQAVIDYDRYLSEHRRDAERNRDPLGRQFRLTNFHLYSEAAMKLAKNSEVMRILDFIFGSEAAIHTSLTFQYSTEQELHRDSPYFHTFPENLFVGVWTAFQDIHPDSGPLSYVPGSHRFSIDQHVLYNAALARWHDPDAARGAALAEYQQEIARRGHTMGGRTPGLLKKGDVAIWHPQLIHGGSPAQNRELKRQSMVVHCCPAEKHVFVEDVFFQHQKAEAPDPYYNFADSYDRKHGDFGMPGFMPSI